MTKSALVVPSPPPTVASTNAPPDLFSRLPAELRHAIYEYLNFPVGGYVWVDCPGRHDCPHATHFTFHAKRRHPLHVRKGVFQVRRKIERLQFSRVHSNLRRMRGHLVRNNDDEYHDDSDSSDDEDYSSSWENDDDWYLAESNVLGVNKDIRAELMDLVFGRNEVEFGDNMLAIPRFRSPRETPRHVRRPDQIYWLDLEPSTLTHMTSIAIPAREIEEHCRTLSFIIKYATNLRRLTYTCAPNYHVPDEQIIHIAQTLRTVNVTAKKLQTLRFVRKGYKSTRKPDYMRKGREMILERPESGFTALEIWRALDGLRYKPIYEPQIDD